MNHDLTQRLQRIESHLAHLEKQYDELNQVVLAQARQLTRMQAHQRKLDDTVETFELERIRATNPKPPHYQ